MRLIDADAQADLITTFILIHKDKIVDVLQNGDNDFLFALMMQYFDERQTAYDVEKVVEQLENMSNNIPLQYENNYEQGVSDGLDKAIEIVKQGGVGTDDVCEWESDYKIISDKYKRVTGCGHEFYDLHHAVPFKYCPYCGKKILKVGGADDDN